MEVGKMAKRGETRPHRVRYEWENGVKGCESFTTFDRAESFIAKLAENAERRDMTVQVKYEDREGSRA